MEKYVITIDGTSGVGKSTLTKALSTLYAVPYLDTGAMFRSLAYTFIQMYPNKEYTSISSKKIEEIVEDSSFHLLYKNGVTELLYNNNPISSAIRTEEVARVSAQIAPLATVRGKLQKKQHQLAKSSSLIAEGRDMGTVVFPNATCKLFLTASIEERAKRRYNELKEHDKNTTFETILSQLEKRDLLDTTRALSPLIPAEDAHIIDTTKYKEKELIERVKTILSTYGIHTKQ